MCQKKTRLRITKEAVYFFLLTLACSYGLFGQDCIVKCNDTCTGCNNVNGLCDRGCHPGWRGEYCENGWLTHWACVFVLVDMIQLYRYNILLKNANYWKKLLQTLTFLFFKIHCTFVSSFKKFNSKFDHINVKFWITSFVGAKSKNLVKLCSSSNAFNYIKETIINYNC